jgi:hypothetical protein
MQSKLFAIMIAIFVANKSSNNLTAMQTKTTDNMTSKMIACSTSPIFESKLPLHYAIMIAIFVANKSSNNLAAM